MKEILAQNARILAIAPSTRGFGFTVLEGESLVDWGVKCVTGNKNRQCLLKMEEIISHYQPGILVIEDHSAKGSRRAPRIRRLGQQIIAMARSRKINVKLFSRQRVGKVFFADGKGN